MTNRDDIPTGTAGPSAAGGDSPARGVLRPDAASRRRKVVSRGGNLVTGIVAVLLAACVALFVAYPMWRIVSQSLIGPGGLTPEYLSSVWDSYRTPLANSVFTGVCTSMACTVFSIGVALVVVTRKGWGRRLLMGGLLVSMVSPPFVASLAYIQLYGRRGWVTHDLLGLSVDPYGCWGVVLMQTVSFIPLSALLLVGILDKMDRDAVNAARDLGARPPSVLRDVVLRLMGPGILVSLLLTFVRSLADFGTPIIIGGRYSTIAAEIYLQIVGYSDLNMSAAMNVFLLVPSVAAFFIYRALMRRDARLTQAGRGHQGRLDLPLARCGAAGIVCWALAVFFYVVNALQYLCIFASGFLKRRRGTYSFTLDNWNELWGYDTGTLLRSMFYAAVVALVGTLFAMLLSYFVNRRRMPGGTALDCLASLPFMIPGPCFGLGYILAFNHDPLKLTGTAFIVMANMLFKQLPTSTKICAASLAQIPAATEDAVRDLGGSRLSVVKDAVLPQLGPAFLSCFSYNFTTAMTTAGAVLFLISPGQKLAVFTLFDAVYRGDYGIASLMASAIIVVTVAVEAAVFALANRKRRTKRKAG